MTSQLSTAYHARKEFKEHAPAAMRAFTILAHRMKLRPVHEEDAHKEFQTKGLLASMRLHDTSEEHFLSLRLNGDEDTVGEFFNDLDQQLRLLHLKRFKEPLQSDAE